MKKSFILAAAALAVLTTACNNDEVVKAPESDALIAFDGVFANKSTRGYQDQGVTGTTLGEGQNILVYASHDGSTNNVFDAQEVNGQTGAYNPTKPWEPGKTYSFAGIYPSTVSGNGLGKGTVTAGISSEGGDYTLTIDGFTSADGGGLDRNSTSGKTDLMFSNETYTTTTEDPKILSAPDKVKLNFIHAMARVKFSFYNDPVEGIGIIGSGTEDDPYTQCVNITDISLSGALQTGTVSYTADATGISGINWTAKDDMYNNAGIVYFGAATDSTVWDCKTYYTQDLAIPQGQEFESDEYGFLIPTDASHTYVVEFQAYVKSANYLDGKSYTLKATITGVELRAGYSYDFKATLTWQNVTQNDQYPILFEAPTVTPYENGGEKEVGTIQGGAQS